MKKIFKNVAMMLLVMMAFSGCGGSASQSTSVCGKGICPSVYENLPFEMSEVSNPLSPIIKWIL